MKNGLALVFGTFDVLHPGHLRFLKTAFEYGRLIVALTPDVMCRYYKGRLPCRTYEERKRCLEKISYIHKIVPADMRSGSFRIVAKLRPSVIVLGYDQELLRSHLVKRLSDFNLNPALITLKPYRRQLYRASRLRALAENIGNYGI